MQTWSRDTGKHWDVLADGRRLPLPSSQAWVRAQGVVCHHFLMVNTGYLREATTASHCMAKRILSSPIRREGIYHFCRPLAGQREPLYQSVQRHTGRYPEPESNRAHGKQKWRELGIFRKRAKQNFLMVLLQILTPCIFSCPQIPSEKLALWGTTTYQAAVSHEQRGLRTNLLLRGLGVVQCSGACLACIRPCTTKS